MRSARNFALLTLLIATTTGRAQETNVEPQVRNRKTADQRVTTIELSPHFVTTIRLPEPVNAVVVGDPAAFQVEHSEREPKLVFVKPVTMDDATSNLLISTTTGRQISLLLVSHAPGTIHRPVDFLLRYQPAGGFLVEPASIPFAMVAQTANVSGSLASGADLTLGPIPASAPVSPHASPVGQPKADALDDLLERQMRAPLPSMDSHEKLVGKAGNELHAGISEVLDKGQQVIVLFSVINRSHQPVLLMPPQVQLGGRHNSGKLIKQERWSTAEQLPVLDFRLSLRRIGPGGRADGVVMFERPPYKRSSETLFLQVAQSGAIDRPTLVRIGFGVSTSQEGANHAQ
jgi:hypothetical protein